MPLVTAVDVKEMEVVVSTMLLAADEGAVPRWKEGDQTNRPLPA
jgi:hypothetical protein